MWRCKSTNKIGEIEKERRFAMSELGEIIIPEDLKNWYGGGIGVEPVRKLIINVVDWDNLRIPMPKPFGGKNEPEDVNSMETARREGKEEIHLEVEGPGKPISYLWRKDHGHCLFRWDFTSEEFDNKVYAAKNVSPRFAEDGKPSSKFIHIMHVNEIIEAGPRDYVPFYRELILPELLLISNA
jgi:hypothetical protein